MSHRKKSRMTHQRKVILEEFQKLTSHPTADEVYAKVRRRLPKISLGTVYRNLEVLASSGLIRKVDPGHAQMRFEAKTEDHYHVTCIRCGAIEDAPIGPTDDSLADLENALGNLTKHGIFGHRLEFLGLCRACVVRGEKITDEGDAGHT